MNQVANKLSLQEFLDLPESGDAFGGSQSDHRYELVDGELVAKMTPTTPHSRSQKRLLRRIDDWCTSSGIGEVNPEWAVALVRRGVDWSPVPDLTYITKRSSSPRLGWARSLPRNSSATGRNYISRSIIRADDSKGY